MKEKRNRIKKRTLTKIKKNGREGKIITAHPWILQGNPQSLL